MTIKIISRKVYDEVALEAQEWSRQRNIEILKMRSEGLSYQEIAAEFKVTKQRIYSIVNYRKYLDKGDPFAEKKKADREDKKNKRNDEMIKMRYEEGKTLQFIADYFHVSRERVRQIIGNTGCIGSLKDAEKEEYNRKVKARKATKYAVKSGKIEKKPCEVCGDVNSTAHHKNYDDPYDIKWLCRKHHDRLHRQ